MRLASKRAIVTGAVSGIGRRIDERFVQEGARVVLVDVDADAVAEAAAGLGERAVLGLGADVTDAAAVDQAVARAARGLDGIDTVIDNAGIPMVGAAHDLPEDDWDRVIAVDLKSVYLVSRAA